MALLRCWSATPANIGYDVGFFSGRWRRALMPTGAEPEADLAVSFIAWFSATRCTIVRMTTATFSIQMWCCQHPPLAKNARCGAPQNYFSSGKVRATRPNILASMKEEDPTTPVVEL
jgi:hypothetical protein